MPPLIEVKLLNQAEVRLMLATVPTVLRASIIKELSSLTKVVQKELRKEAPKGERRIWRGGVFVRKPPPYLKEGLTAEFNLTGPDAYAVSAYSIVPYTGWVIKGRKAQHRSKGRYVFWYKGRAHFTTSTRASRKNDFPSRAMNSIIPDAERALNRIGDSIGQHWGGRVTSLFNRNPAGQFTSVGF